MNLCNLLPYRGLYAISCHWYCKDTILKAIHNRLSGRLFCAIVVTDIAKILFWKQFTTETYKLADGRKLSLILQRYYFESNSQPFLNCAITLNCCHWYCKDTILKAIHNNEYAEVLKNNVVTDIAKILFWKQFTTCCLFTTWWFELSLILQRYYFESNSQQIRITASNKVCCHWYCKDTILKAIHNFQWYLYNGGKVVTDIAKILFWKQFTTAFNLGICFWKLSLILQRYYFESNSQQT